MVRVLALALAIAAAAVYVGAFHVTAVHDADAAVLWLLTRPDNTPVEDLLEVFVLSLHPVVYALGCGALLRWAWRERGAREAIVAAVIIAGANLTTQVLKPLLADERVHDMLDNQIDAAAWPSGHATGAAALALAVWVLMPHTRRYGIAFAGAMGVAVVSLNWHYPSDALGGYLVAGAWTAAAVTRLRPAATAAPRRRSPRATG